MLLLLSFVFGTPEQNQKIKSDDDGGDDDGDIGV